MRPAIIAILIILLAVAKCHLNLKVDKFNCIANNRTVISNLTCWVKPYNRTNTLVNLRGYVAEELDGLYLMTTLYKKAEIIYRRFMFNITIDWCLFFASKSSSAYFRIIAPIILPYTNVNHTCPYSGHIIIKDLLVDPLKIPPMWPTGSYRVDVKTMSKGGGQLYMSMELFFTVIEILGLG